jgi:hypothetical protein
MVSKSSSTSKQRSQKSQKNEVSKQEKVEAAIVLLAKDMGKEWLWKVNNFFKNQRSWWRAAVEYRLFEQALTDGNFEKISVDQLLAEMTAEDWRDLFDSEISPKTATGLVKIFAGK